MASPSFSFYTASIQRAGKNIRALEAVLKKGEQAPNAASLPLAPLHEHMLPLATHVFIACSFARKVVTRTTGLVVPEPDMEMRTFEEMHACVAATLKMLGDADEGTVNDRAGKMVMFRVAEELAAGIPAGGIVGHSVADMVENSDMPAVCFHAVTAYHILRKEGVPLRMVDFQAPFRKSFP